MTERRNHRWFWLQLTIGAVRLHPHAEPGGTGTSTGLSVWLYLDMSSWKISEAIRGNQNKSEAIRHELVEDLRGNPRKSAVPRRELEAVRGHQRQSAAISGNQRYLAASSRQSASMAVQPLSTPAKRPRHTHAKSSPKATMRNAVTSAMTRNAR